jgi:hypothetical protein
MGLDAGITLTARRNIPMSTSGRTFVYASITFGRQPNGGRCRQIVEAIKTRLQAG